MAKEMVTVRRDASFIPNVNLLKWKGGWKYEKTHYSFC